MGPNASQLTIANAASTANTEKITLFINKPPYSFVFCCINPHYRTFFEPCQGNVRNF